MDVITTSGEETQHIGALIGEVLDRPLLICLEGTLGAGKTTFAQGLAVGIGISPDIPVTSPTYALIHEYSHGRLPFYHVDLYRLEGDEEDLENIGFYELLAHGIVAVEWAERLDEATRGDALRISLIRTENDQHRSIHLSATGLRSKEIFSRIQTRLEGVLS